MLERLRIKNFQSHEDTTLDFVPGINVIAGKSQSGKTAILRAFRLLVKNRPLGLRYLSHFAKDGIVEVLCSPFSSAMVKLRKSKSGGQYFLDKREFKKFGSSVPDEIEKVLNIGDLNIQGQLDPPFLATDSPGEVARIINRVTKLEDVDVYVSKVTKRINLANKEVVVLERHLFTAEEELKLFADIGDLNGLMIELKENEQVLGKAYHDRQVLDTTLISIEDKATEVNTLKEFLVAEPYIGRAEKLEVEIVRLVGVVNQIENLLETGGIIAKYRVEYGKMKDEYISLLRKLGICPVCGSEISDSCIAEIERDL